MVGRPEVPSRGGHGLQLTADDDAAGLPFCAVQAMVVLLEGISTVVEISRYLAAGTAAAVTRGG